RELLGDVQGSMYPGFDKMVHVWEDLEKWANEDNHGSLGLFTPTVAGGWVHVGIPLAQTLLTESERAALPSIFCASNLDPKDFPPDGEIIRILATYGAHQLRRRTLNVLSEQSKHGEVISVLLGIIKEELARWDGSVQSHDSPESVSGALK